MKATYRGHEIEVKREKCLGGETLLFMTIIRQSDGYFCLDDASDEEATVREMVGTMKERIDNELAEEDPWMEKEGLGRLYG